jgi:hypothetical protein
VHRDDHLVVGPRKAKFLTQPIEFTVVDQPRLAPTGRPEEDVETALEALDGCSDLADPLVRLPQASGYLAGELVELARPGPDRCDVYRRRARIEVAGCAVLGDELVARGNIAVELIDALGLVADEPFQALYLATELGPYSVAVLRRNSRRVPVEPFTQWCCDALHETTAREAWHGVRRYLFAD